MSDNGSIRLLVQFLLDKSAEPLSGLDCTWCGHRMAHRKWKETKQQLSMLPGPAVPGCCLVSYHFLWILLSTSTAEVTKLPLNHQTYSLRYRLRSLHTGKTQRPASLPIAAHPRVGVESAHMDGTYTPNCCYGSREVGATRMSTEMCKSIPAKF